MEDEVILSVEGSTKFSSIPQCRICHEEEVRTQRLEAPCACSGTVKFAHRECIQRWCNEKGDTTCEICLQKFEPGYTAPPKKAHSADVVVTIRGSLESEVPLRLRRQEQELRNPGLMAIVAAEPDYSECTSAAERSASCCRSVALTFGVLLLLRHLLALLAGETDHYAFTILILFVLRAGGIIVPLYVMMRTITAIQRRIHRQHQDFGAPSPFQVDEDDGDDENEYSNYTIHTQVHS
ncbi:uncharacterized protein LOC122091122 isoform X2 [Macadamia integrifolia]|uniref:uncharacterized protein LOC122091122 isoform X2 n=1 Tax=Macadamia integrifolia TaxID=60698 RepID=UPI001C4F0CDE|nr:uncharacterized protein LOC122091122 isoform X2 [Macadamia integrifolia]